jgi:hypothetical protein
VSSAWTRYCPRSSPTLNVSLNAHIVTWFGDTRMIDIPNKIEITNHPGTVLTKTTRWPEAEAVPCIIGSRRQPTAQREMLNPTRPLPE